MRTSALACAVLAAGVSAEVYFEDNFETDPFESNRWVVSDWRDGDSGKWGWQSGEWSVDAEKEKGLFTTDDMKFYAISSKLDKSFRCVRGRGRDGSGVKRHPSVDNSRLVAAIYLYLC